MRKWNTGLVNAFPIPEDRLPGNRFHKKKVATLPEELGKQLDSLTLKDVDSNVKEDMLEDDPKEYNLNPFRFFDLPAELRNKVYDLVLFSKSPESLRKGRRWYSRLAILIASKRFHAESSYTLYTTHKFLVFPIQVFDALPTIQELPLHYRRLVSNMEMVVGSSWTSPPKSWRVGKGLTRVLKNMKNVQTLSVFVDFDPSHPAFKKYRVSFEFYTDFCGDLLGDVLEVMPQLKYVQLDGNSGVDFYGPLVSRLREEALAQDKEIKYGRVAGWAKKVLEGRHTVKISALGEEKDEVEQETEKFSAQDDD